MGKVQYFTHPDFHIIFGVGFSYSYSPLTVSHWIIAAIPKRLRSTKGGTSSCSSTCGLQVFWWPITGQLGVWHTGHPNRWKTKGVIWDWCGWSRFRQDVLFIISSTTIKPYLRQWQISKVADAQSHKSHCASWIFSWLAHLCMYGFSSLLLSMSPTAFLFDPHDFSRVATTYHVVNQVWFCSNPQKTTNWMYF